MQWSSNIWNWSPKRNVRKGSVLSVPTKVGVLISRQRPEAFERDAHVLNVNCIENYVKTVSVCEKYRLNEADCSKLMHNCHFPRSWENK